MQGYNPTAFQQALYQLLTGDLVLMALVEGVYSVVPEHTDFPYILLHMEQIQPYNVTGLEGVEITFSVSCYSQTPGQAELYAILQQTFETLQDSQPIIGGYSLVNLRFTGSQFDILNDGVTAVGSIFFRSILQKI